MSNEVLLVVAFVLYSKYDCLLPSKVLSYPTKTVKEPLALFLL